MENFAPVLGIVVILYAVSEILKRTVFKNNADMKAVIPFFCAIVGGIAGAVMFAVDSSLITNATNIIDAVFIGALSGLLATGANQVYKQFLNLLAIGKSTAEEVQKNVENMTEEEKKEYLTDVATDMAKDIIEKLDNDDKKSEEANSVKNPSTSDTSESSDTDITK